MEKVLSKAERELVQELLSWDRWRRPSEWMLCRLALLLGAVVIVGAAGFTVIHLNDRVILAVLVPSVLLGLFLIGLFVVHGQRIRERQRLASIIRALGGAI